MPMNSRNPHDPHWDRVVEIASKLRIHGRYVAEIDRTQTQLLVDLQWAAHRAGRLLGGRAKIHTTGAPAPGDRTVTVVVVLVS